MDLKNVSRPLGAVAATGLMLTTAACGGSSSKSSDAGSDASSAATTPSATASSAAAGSSTGAYKAGSYEATGSYQTPGGTESIDVDLTITADGTISKVKVTGNATGGNSEMFQKKFVSGISSVATGKKISELKVDKVSGSSLTGNGFNAAVAEIAKKAQA